jgi:hypothetical protein
MLATTAHSYHFFKVMWNLALSSVILAPTNNSSIVGKCHGMFVSTTHCHHIFQFRRHITLSMSIITPANHSPHLIHGCGVVLATAEACIFLVRLHFVATAPRILETKGTTERERANSRNEYMNCCLV